MIPFIILSNTEKYDSQFKNLKFLIDLTIINWFKILNDLELGTNKFLLSLRGMPNGQAKVKYIKMYEDLIRKGTIIADDMLMINPNSANAMDKMYGSLQTDQLYYSSKMNLGLLKEFCLITIGSTSKNSAQQNNIEVAKDNQIVINDNEKNKYIWENQLEELAYIILNKDKYIGGNNTNLNVKIKCNIKMSKNELDLINNNNKNKGEFNNE